MGRIRTRIRLGDRQCGERSLGDTRQKPQLLLLGPKIDQWLCRVKIRRPDDAGRGAGAAQLAHAGEIGGIAQNSPAISLGDEDRIETERVDRIDIVPREFAAAIVLLGAWRDLVARQYPYAIEDQHLLG